MKRTNAREESVAPNRPKACIHSAFAVKGAANTLRHARCAPLPSRIHKVRIALQAARYNSGLKTWVRKPCEMTEVQPRSESGAGAALTFSNTHDTWTSSGSQRLERAARPHARQVLRRTRPPDECDSHTRLNPRLMPRLSLRSIRQNTATHLKARAAGETRRAHVRSQTCENPH